MEQYVAIVIEKSERSPSHISCSHPNAEEVSFVLRSTNQSNVCHHHMGAVWYSVSEGIFQLIQSDPIHDILLHILCHLCKNIEKWDISLTVLLKMPQQWLPFYRSFTLTDSNLSAWMSSYPNLKGADWRIRQGFSGMRFECIPDHPTWH